MQQICQICLKKFSNERGLVNHISRIHKMDILDYYDKFVLKRPKCKFCGNDVKFISIYEGYGELCGSKECGILSQKENFKKTCIEKYGVDNISKVDTVKRVRQNTMMQKYGVDNVSKIDSIKQRKKELSFEKYGVGCTANGKEPSEKKWKTWIERYGGHPCTNYLIRQKQIESCIKKYGVSYSHQSSLIFDNVKQSWVNKYGVDNPMKNRSIQEKCFESNNRAYQIKSYITKFGDTITYQSNLELLFIYLCEDKNIRILNGESIKYQFNNREHIYHIDFKIFENNKIRLIEIKDNHIWWKHDLQTGLAVAKIRAAVKYSREHRYLPFKIKFNVEVIK